MQLTARKPTRALHVTDRVYCGMAVNTKRSCNQGIAGRGLVRFGQSSGIQKSYRQLPRQYQLSRVQISTEDVQE